MQRERYKYLCAEVASGNDAFVRHPDTNEEGMITSCTPQSDHLIVRTSQGDKRCWDYRTCEELERSKLGPIIYF